MPRDLSPLDVLNLAAFLFCIVFCAYVVAILVPYLRTRRAHHGDPDRYDWHVIIPCLDEAAVIGGTVRRLLTDFPELTIWCVDDGSTDGTGAVLAAIADERVRVIRRYLPFARQGKGAALNAAWHAINAEMPRRADRSSVLVGVVDADSQLDPACLRILAAADYFGDSAMSAVQIEVRMNAAHLGVSVPNRFQRLLVRLQDMEFRGPISAMQQLRRRTGSVALGGNGQFSRLSALNDIAVEHGTPWHGALLEDFELGLHVLLTGGRTGYAQETWVAQEALIAVGPLLRQRARWAQGSMQCMRYLRAVLRSRNIANPAALELVYFLFLPWIQLAATFVYIGSTIVLGWYVETTPGHVDGWWNDGGWSLIPLTVAFGIAPFAIWGPIYRTRTVPRIGWGRAVGLGLAHWLYSYAQCVATWMAFIRLVRAQSDWQKTRRAADRPLAAPRSRRASPGTLFGFRRTQPIRFQPITEVHRYDRATPYPPQFYSPPIYSDRSSGGQQRRLGTVYRVAGDG